MIILRYRGLIIGLRLHPQEVLHCVFEVSAQFRSDQSSVAMKGVFLEQAQGRLNHTRRAFGAMTDSRDDTTAFQAHWLDFVIQWKGTYTKIQQAAKETPQETQWFGTVTKERKADPLLRYLFEARNDGEHPEEGLLPRHPARHYPQLTKFVPDRDITNPKLAFDAKGRLVKVTDQDGNDVGGIGPTIPAESILLEVTERDHTKKVPPPRSHLGQPMEPKPRLAAELGLRWLETLVAKAEAMHRP